MPDEALPPATPEFRIEHQPPVAAPADPMFWGWADVAMAFGLLIPSAIVGGILALLVAVALAGFKMPDIKVLTMPMQLAWYLVWLAMLWGWFRWRHHRPMWTGLFWAIPDRWFPYLAFGPILGFVAGALGYLMNAQNIKMEMIEQLLKDPIQRPLFIAFGVSIGPICEEMFFRGIVLPVAAKKWGNAAALLLTSLPFAAIHGPQYEWSMAHMAILTLVSVAYASRRGSTGAAAITHCAYNLFMFIGMSLNKV